MKWPTMKIDSSASRDGKPTSTRLSMTCSITPVRLPWVGCLPPPGQRHDGSPARGSVHSPQPDDLRRRTDALVVIFVIAASVVFLAAAVVRFARTK